MTIFAFIGGYGTEDEGFDITTNLPAASGYRRFGGTVYTNTIYMYPSGGTPPYTYTVTYAGGDAFNIEQSANTVRFSAYIEFQDSLYSGWYTLKVTDSKGAEGIIENFPAYLSSGFWGGTD